MFDDSDVEKNGKEKKEKEKEGGGKEEERADNEKKEKVVGGKEGGRGEGHIAGGEEEKHAGEGAGGKEEEQAENEKKEEDDTGSGGPEHIAGGSRSRREARMEGELEQEPWGEGANRGEGGGGGGEDSEETDDQWRKRKSAEWVKGHWMLLCQAMWRRYHQEGWTHVELRSRWEQMEGWEAEYHNCLRGMTEMRMRVKKEKAESGEIEKQMYGGKRQRPYQEDDVEDSVEKRMKIAGDEKDEKEEEERREPAETESRGSPSREEPMQDGNNDDADGDYDFESLALSVADFTAGGERTGSVVDDVADTLPDSPVQDGTPWWWWEWEQTETWIRWTDLFSHREEKTPRWR